MRKGLSPQNDRDFWVVEHIRRQDAHEDRYDDHAVVAELRATAQPLAAKVIARANQLAQQRHVLSAIQRTDGLLKLVPFIIVALALITGTGLVRGALLVNAPNINVLALLASVLLVNFIMLILWGGSLLIRPTKQNGVAGRLLSVSTWVRATFSPSHADDSQRESSLQSWLAVQQANGLLQLWFSRWTHLFWLVTLGVAAVYILWKFSFSGYQLVWSTTILNDDTVFTFLALFTWATELLGIPSPTLIEAGQSDSLQLGQSQSYVLAPRSTGIWLLSVIILFGVMPRLCLWLAAHLLYRRRKKRMKLDFTQPGLAPLLPRLQPQLSDVVDPEPETISPTKRQKAAVIGKDYFVFTLDYEPVPEWNDVFLLESRGVVASHAEREALLEALQAEPARKVLVRVDTQITPDRGSLRYLAKVQQYCNYLAVWCVGHGKYQTQWLEILAEQHISGFSFPDEAIRWLRDEESGHG